MYPGILKKKEKFRTCETFSGVLTVLHFKILRSKTNTSEKFITTLFLFKLRCKDKTRVVKPPQTPIVNRREPHQRRFLERLRTACSKSYQENQDSTMASRLNTAKTSGNGVQTSGSALRPLIHSAHCLAFQDPSKGVPQRNAAENMACCPRKMAAFCSEVFRK
jgi:hypothetical protein